MSNGSAIKDLERWAQLAGNELLSMPVSVYTSAELLGEEVEKLFYKQWVCVGHVSELQNSGDYLTFDIVDKPVLIVRDETGKIRAYSNVCRHRGTVIASGHGSCKLFSCPYHAWSYDLNGRLRAAPFMDMEKLRDVLLPEYIVEIWQGFVFVNLSPEVAALGTLLQELEKKISPYEFAEHKTVYRAGAKMSCNWKIMIENFCESYHHFRVHKTTLEPTLPTNKTKVWNGGIAFNHHTVTTEETDCAIVKKLPPDLRNLSHNICIYPGLMIGKDPGGVLLWLSVLPTGPQTCKFSMGLLVDKDTEITPEAIKQEQDYLNGFMDEDIETTELVQQGLAAGVDTTGVLHPDERAIWEFGHYLAQQITGAPTIDVTAINFS